MGDVTPKPSDQFDANMKYNSTGSDKVLLASENGFALFVYGNTLPTDADSGYEVGCIFSHIDGTDGTALYVNEGSTSSCDFNLITVAAA